MSFFNQIHSKRIYRRAFSGTRNSRDSHANGTTGIGQAFFDNCLSHCLMFRFGAFHQRYRLTQHSDISGQNSFDPHWLRTLAPAAQVSQSRVLSASSDSEVAQASHVVLIEGLLKLNDMAGAFKEVLPEQALAAMLAARPQGASDA